MTACIPWTGKVDRFGYGRDGASDNGKAHRAVYQAIYGPIPAGLDIDHTCHNADTTCSGGWSCLHRRCVNPLHLEAVTHKTNVLRGRSFSALNAAKTRCKNGHPFDDQNTYRQGGTRRQCRACNLAAVRRYQERKAAA